MMANFTVASIMLHLFIVLVIVNAATWEKALDDVDNHSNNIVNKALRNLRSGALFKQTAGGYGYGGDAYGYVGGGGIGGVVGGGVGVGGGISNGGGYGSRGENGGWYGGGWRKGSGWVYSRPGNGGGLGGSGDGPYEKKSVAKRGLKGL